MAKRKRRQFSTEFNADAVRLTQAGDRSIAQVALDLDLTETALREWVKRAEIDASPSAIGALTTAEREELNRLRRDNKRLQMEREILKLEPCLADCPECPRAALRGRGAQSRVGDRRNVHLHRRGNRHRSSRVGIESPGSPVAPRANRARSPAPSSPRSGGAGSR